MIKLIGALEEEETFSTMAEVKDFLESKARKLLETVQSDFERCGFYPPAVAGVGNDINKARARVNDYWTIGR